MGSNEYSSGNDLEQRGPILPHTSQPWGRKPHARLMNTRKAHAGLWLDEREDVPVVVEK
jgi:hypothetical protein